jgi:anhydro-N-acetylmuramic acid kinase
MQSMPPWCVLIRCPVSSAPRACPTPPVCGSELTALATPGPGEIDRLGQADVRVGRHFAAAIDALLAGAGVAKTSVRAIGSHGQTIRHRPRLDAPFTLQIGDPNVIAVETGLPVVADFRRKDMALGGQGAPLVPAFHEAVFRSAQRDRIVLNIGGIANLTVLPARADGAVTGFDTGPGNTLLDRWANRVLGEAMDRDGRLAAAGQVRPDLLARLQSDPYFRQPPPKSTGPEQFTLEWLDAHLAAMGEVVSAADVQATLLALTAETIGSDIRRLPGIQAPDVFVCGGGARNPVLMQALQHALPGSKVDRTEALGVPGEWVEAMAFAWLARQHMEKRPGNLPAVTGARRLAVLGGLFLPD